VPFVAPLASPLSLGKSISVKGVVPLYSEMFTITIQSGPEYPPADSVVQMSITPDFSMNKTSLCYYDGEWHCEDHDRVFTLGRSFHLVITCLEDMFQVKIRFKRPRQIY